MNMTIKALIWAGIIIATAFYLNSTGLNQGASFGITSGLAGAAWGSLHTSRTSRCSKGCA